LILGRVHVEHAGRGEPGTVLEAAGERLVVATGDGSLVIESIQPAGKRALSAADFLRGYPVRAGEKFAG
jgi:methionyl-tRNA formyltransferase